MKQVTSLIAMVDATIAIEKQRVASQVRQTHLFLNGIGSLVKEGIISSGAAEDFKELWRKKRLLPQTPYIQLLHDPEADELCKRLISLEEFIDGRVSYLIKSHPAYSWFSLVKGIGRENIGKVVALIDITKAGHISSLWKFAGFDVGEDGKAPKRIKGEKLTYNSQLRSMCWRLGSSLIKARGKFYHYYLEEKDKYYERFNNQGYKILATPTGKWVCINCGTSWDRKRDIVPCCSSQEIEKKVRQEPLGVKWVGHIDAMARRKMIKLFLACLWLVWREAEGLILSMPYAIDKLGHTKCIDPWDMVDKPKHKRKP